MRIHHLNCGAMQPYGGALFDGQSPVAGPAELSCHCLLLETPSGLTLVDTGTVSSDPGADAARMDPLFRTLDRPRLDPAESAARQIVALGHDPADVQTVIMTHLDFDHAAGLTDFPRADVHLSATEAEAARHPRGPIARRRYRPGQWGDIGRWRRHGTFGLDWFGLQAAPVLDGVLLVWLPGHTDGHCGVAIQTGDTWLLHAGDAAFHHRELDPVQPATPTAARGYQWMMQTSQVRRRRSLKALRRVVRDHGDSVRVICTHDPSLLRAVG